VLTSREDIDWEYPGGNGNDYKQISNSDKVSEIDTYPILLQAIRDAIGPEKVLSIAVPGLQRDMIAFTKEKGPSIFEPVDMVNVMTYDLMNRRDNVTKHHTSIQGSLDSISSYLDIGLDPAKANLGIAFYAKYFTTDPASDCATEPIGCGVVAMENPDGTDNGKSGALTFEAVYMAPAPADLKDSTDGTCGPTKGKCPNGSCCSAYGNWYAIIFFTRHCSFFVVLTVYFSGSGDTFCGTGCLSDYGTCQGLSITDSWKKALSDGKTDDVAGGQYYWDADSQLFWSWDTPDLMTKKFSDIIAAKKLGGVMAWSLGEDGYDWSHVKALRDGAAAAT
jgi:chitinase